MVSINTSANSAVLASIRQINNDLATTQLRIGTGKKVNSASDNASVWSLAQNLRSEQTMQDTLNTGMTLAKGRADTAVTALDTVIKLLGQVKTLAAGGAADNSSNYATIATKITALNAQISSTVSSAAFKGSNWLTSAAASDATVTIGFNGATAQTVAVTTKNLNLAVSGDLTVYTGTTAVTDQSSAATYSTAVDTAIAALTSYQGTLSSFSSSLGIQQDFLKSVAAIRDSAISSLVDADLTEENAKVSALQTQQQLAYQALSIGNNSAQNILRLFQ